MASVIPFFVCGRICLRLLYVPEDFMRKLSFVKMHGLGNDFIIIDGIGEKLAAGKWNDLSIRMCNRNTGIGADGLILALPARRGDFRMRIFNSDGSEAEMCGNGLRCLIRLLHDRKYLVKKTCGIEAGKRIVEARIVSAKKSDFQVRYCVGKPDFHAANIPIKIKEDYFINRKIMVMGRNFVVTSLSVGNPHTVVFVDDLDFDWQEVGQEIEVNKLFPNRTNVEFVLVASQSRVFIKSWERGAGPTLASGTGACAAVAAGVMVGLLKHEVEVVCELGCLNVEWSSNDDYIYQTGPAEYSFYGTF